MAHSEATQYWIGYDNTSASTTLLHRRRSCEGPWVRTLAKIVLRGSVMYWTLVKIWRKRLIFCGKARRKLGLRFNFDH